jgi:hypothetical protein
VTGQRITWQAVVEFALALTVAELQQAHRIAPVHQLAVLFRNWQSIENGDRLTDVHRTAFRIERRVGCEHHVIGAEETQSADGRLVAAEERRVGVEHPEIVERPLGKIFQDDAVVLV